MVVARETTASVSSSTGGSVAFEVAELSDVCSSGASVDVVEVVEVVEVVDVASVLFVVGSSVELEGLRDGLKANKEKKHTLENTAERLRAERNLLNEQLTALTEQMKFLTESTEKKGDTK